MDANSGEKTRVFFSFHIPEHSAGNLLSPLAGNPRCTLYPEKNLHITLAFVGDATASEIEILKKIASDIAANTPPIQFSPEKFEYAGDRIRARMRSSGTLRRLYDALAKKLEHARIGKPLQGNYIPHVTLARPEREFEADSIPEKIEPVNFTATSFGLYRSEQTPDGMGRYTRIASFELEGKNQHETRYSKIVLPARAQPDTIVSIFILKKFGEDYFPGIHDAEIDFWQVVPPEENEESLAQKGVLLIDLGGGTFDHHAKTPKTTASHLIAEHLGVAEHPALAKMLQYAERDDFYGKGTISQDPIDRAFGLSALITALNKSLVKNPARVVEIIMPIFIAHYNEELRRTEELPKEFEEKLRRKEAETFEIHQRDKKLKVVILTSESGSMAGFLRSKMGGAFDVVAQWLPSGHINILTRPTKRIDLRSLAAIIRIEEATRAGLELEMDIRGFARFGRIDEIPEWYYDPATNSIQNGGLNPKEIPATKISKEEFKKILELGLAEKLWDPRSNETRIESEEET